MNGVRRFLAVCRNFGIVVALKITFSKLRGKLWPALALPEAAVLDTTPRELTVILSTIDQTIQTMETLVELLAARGGSTWDLCISERAPLDPEMARALATCRGKHPWLRIVRADQSVNDMTAAQWTVEQATGQFVALVTPGFTPSVDAFNSLLARLRAAPDLQAAVLVSTRGDPDTPPSQHPSSAPHIVLQRKSSYLANQEPATCWPLMAPALAQQLSENGVPTVYVTECQSETHN